MMSDQHVPHAGAGRGGALRDHATIRWGIIGCGDVTEVKSGPGFQKAEGSRLVAVMRRNGALARDYASRHGVPRWYDTADALMAENAAGGAGRHIALQNVEIGAADRRPRDLHNRVGRRS